MDYVFFSSRKFLKLLILRTECSNGLGGRILGEQGFKHKINPSWSHGVYRAPGYVLDKYYYSTIV